MKNFLGNVLQLVNIFPGSLGLCYDVRRPCAPVSLALFSADYTHSRLIIFFRGKRGCHRFSINPLAMENRRSSFRGVQWLLCQPRNSSVSGLRAAGGPDRGAVAAAGPRGDLPHGAFRGGRCRAFVSRPPRGWGGGRGLSHRGIPCVQRGQAGLHAQAF